MSAFFIRYVRDVLQLVIQRRSCQQLRVHKTQGTGRGDNNIFIVGRVISFHRQVRYHSGRNTSPCKQGLRRLHRANVKLHTSGRLFISGFGLAVKVPCRFFRWQTVSLSYILVSCKKNSLGVSAEGCHGKAQSSGPDGNFQCLSSAPDGFIRKIKLTPPHLTFQQKLCGHKRAVGQCTVLFFSL